MHVAGGDRNSRNNERCRRQHDDFEVPSQHAASDQAYCRKPKHDVMLHSGASLSSVSARDSCHQGPIRPVNNSLKSYCSSCRGNAARSVVANWPPHMQGDCRSREWKRIGPFVDGSVPLLSSRAEARRLGCKNGGRSVGVALPNDLKGRLSQY